MLLRVRVVPNSPKTEIEQLGENQLRVKVAAPPARGRANQELIEALARYYGKPRRSIEIKKGLHSRDKLVEIKE